MDRDWFVTKKTNKHYYRTMIIYKQLQLLRRRFFCSGTLRIGLEQD